MKVALVSEHIIRSAKYGYFGLNRLATEFYKSITKISEKDSFVVASLAPRASKEDENNFRKKHEYRKLAWGLKSIAIPIWATTGMLKIDHWIKDCDIVHSLDFGLPIPTKKPWIITVQDLGPLAKPDFFSKSKSWINKAALRMMLKSANMIVTISEASAKELQGFSEIDLSSRLRVIHLGASQTFFEKSMINEMEKCLKEFNIKSKQYYLCVGSLNPRKNLERVISAFELVACGNEHCLVLIGGSGWDFNKLMERITNSRFSKRIKVLGYQTDSILKILYR
jgi:glycosyltransferase involved in cell wall biosynthesis